MNSYTADELIAVTKTFRGNGAVGNGAIVPRLVAVMARPDDAILDYGCGKDRLHVNRLSESGFRVSGYDLSIPESKGALDTWYDIVYASNVLNVQPTKAKISEVVDNIADCVKNSGVFLVNYPESPRKSDATVEEVESVLKTYYHNVLRIAGSDRAPVWKCYGFKVSPCIPVQ